MISNIASTSCIAAPLACHGYWPGCDGMCWLGDRHLWVRSTHCDWGHLHFLPMHRVYSMHATALARHWCRPSCNGLCWLCDRCLWVPSAHCDCGTCILPRRQLLAALIIVLQAAVQLSACSSIATRSANPRIPLPAGATKELLCSRTAGAAVAWCHEPRHCRAMFSAVRTASGKDASRRGFTALHSSSRSMEENYVPDIWGAPDWGGLCRIRRCGLATSKVQRCRPAGSGHSRGGSG